MIDTIVLALDSASYTIIEPDRFMPSASFVTLHGAPIQAKQNPTQRELKAGIYKPRLTLACRANANGVRDIVLKIELSLPKLFFGNNFQELQYKDFAPLVSTLTITLNGMGVVVSESVLAQASIYTVHYAKNIILTDGSTPYHFINKLKQANISLSRDVNQTDYRNDGHSYKWHCNAYEVVFYDKIKDLFMAQISDKRALEKDNELQAHLIQQLQRRKKWEVLRMEVRLNKRRKIKQVLAATGIKTELTFKKLFKPAISKKVLLHYLDELDRKRPPHIDYRAPSDKALLSALLINNPGASFKKILQLFGFKKALETMEVRELRIILSMCSKKSWERILADARQMVLPATAGPFVALREQIIKGKPILFKDANTTNEGDHNCSSKHRRTKRSRQFTTGTNCAP